MKAGSLFTGIGGFDLGFEQCGIPTAWQVEQDKDCRQILAQHFPGADRFDDVRTVGSHNLEPVDILTAGVPCQDVSVAGKRAGLAGERTGLFYEFARILQELRPPWFVFENVPGLFSSNNGRDFAEVLRVLMVECGYGVCWRVLDSQFFGVAQRRERVFIVGNFGRPCPPEILFESASGSRDSAKGGKTWKEVAAPLTSGSGVTSNAPGRRSEDDINLVPQLHPALTSRDYKSVRTDIAEPGFVVANTLTTEYGQQAYRGDGNDNIIASALGNASGVRGWKVSAEDAAGNHIIAADRIGTLRANAGAPKHESDERQLVCQAPDSHRMRGAAGISEGLDLLPEGQDSRRYRQLGNAVTVSVARWIGQRIMNYERQAA